MFFFVRRVSHVACNVIFHAHDVIGDVNGVMDGINEQKQQKTNNILDLCVCVYA